MPPRQLRAIAHDMTAETDHGRRAAQQGFETRLAFERRQPHQILAVKMQQIEAAVLKVAIGALFKGRPGFSRVLAG
jgi:hypothetical protein